MAEAYPDAVEHIMAKRREMLRAVDKLDGLVRARDTQLTQNQQLLEYLATFRYIRAGHVTNIRLMISWWCLFLDFNDR